MGKVFCHPAPGPASRSDTNRFIACGHRASNATSVSLLLHASVVPVCCAILSGVWQAFNLSSYLVTDPNAADLFLVPAVMYCLTDGKVINFTGAPVPVAKAGCDAVIVQVNA